MKLKSLWCRLALCRDLDRVTLPIAELPCGNNVVVSVASSAL